MASKSGGLSARWRGRVPLTGKHKEQDAGDDFGPPRLSAPPSPLLTLMSFSLS
ncbi:MAG TPA: hypothetical protein VKB35_06800 [Ktedonobacteraceae bacterium]|nr:hypothetical protein [Ktedonobacteraceae bacterium]